MGRDGVELSLTHEFAAGLTMKQALAAIQYAGFAYVNITARECCRLASSGLPERASLRDRLAGHGLRVDWFHAPFMFPALYSPDEETWAVSIAAQRTALRIASDLGARAVVVHPLNPAAFSGELDIEASCERLERAFRVLVDDGQRHGLEVTVENVIEPETHRLVPHLLDTVEGLGLCFDAGHANLSDTWSLYLDRYGSRVRALHLHDNDGVRDEHRVPGEATVDFDGLARRLIGAGYEGVWGIECQRVPVRDEDDARRVARRAYETVYRAAAGAAARAA